MKRKYEKVITATREERQEGGREGRESRRERGREEGREGGKGGGRERRRIAGEKNVWFLVKIPLYKFEKRSGRDTPLGGPHIYVNSSPH